MSRSRIPFSVASLAPRFNTWHWANVRFCVTVRCGKSSKCWKTIPTRERSLGRFVRRSPTEIPSIRISPSWNGSRPFTHLIKVDLPDPDGPQTTTTSPLVTSVLQSFNTWKSPYHFETFLIEIIRLFSFAIFPQASTQRNRLRDRQSRQTG